ncbi:MAG: hypothetical protein A2170_10075 [Deltaproteobacteria bacterium RBG_13_53_10]|nr:MAG: hypothetical protein A2170_10075 [Deltaproteobacteria bacterium RBG_13_53_10]
MYICYLDESGTVEPTPDSSHFVFVGLAIPAETWKQKDREVFAVKRRFDIENAEIHTGWMLRPYPEQRRVPEFEGMDYPTRRRAVLGVRALNLSRPRENHKQGALLKNYRKTEPYVHLTQDERVECISSLAQVIGSWVDCRLYGEAHDKTCSFGPRAYEMAFEQIVTRFNTFLSHSAHTIGMLVQDHNETVCRKLTKQMREYHRAGTLWSAIENIVETPLFVDSQLTSMVQIADVCSFLTRRFFEKRETTLFDIIYTRFDRNRGRLVGLRHYTGSQACLCRVCEDHGRSSSSI